MIILNVGGYKSGSTWVQNILQTIQAHGRVDEDNAPPIPAELENAINPRDRAELVWQLMSDSACKALTYKVHFYEFGSFELRHHIRPHARFVNVVRDKRDAFVSFFYHQVGGGKFDGDFAAFFEEEYKGYLQLRGRYDAYWNMVERAFPDQIITLNYETLKTDFAGEVKRLLSFLGSDKPFEELAHLYDLKTNKKVGTKPWMEIFEEKGSGFYRKGVIGDFKNHFSWGQRVRFTTRQVLHRLKIV